MQAIHGRVRPNLRPHSAWEGCSLPLRAFGTRKTVAHSAILLQFLMRQLGIFRVTTTKVRRFFWSRAPRGGENPQVKVIEIERVSIRVRYQHQRIRRSDGVILCHDRPPWRRGARRGPATRRPGTKGAGSTRLPAPRVGSAQTDPMRSGSSASVFRRRAEAAVPRRSLGCATT